MSASTGAAEPRGRSWFEQVERDRDRGAGRIVDDATWETQRLEERRDVRLGRLTPRREFDRFDEERDRELQLQASARRHERGPARGLGVSAADQSAILSRPPTTGLPTLAGVVARDQRELAEAKQTLERSLRAVDAAEARELRLLRRRLNRDGRSERFDIERGPIEQRFGRLRTGYRQAYDKVRSRITGRHN